MQWSGRAKYTACCQYKGVNRIFIHPFFDWVIFWSQKSALSSVAQSGCPVLHAKDSGSKPILAFLSLPQLLTDHWHHLLNVHFLVDGPFLFSSFDQSNQRHKETPLRELPWAVSWGLPCRFSPVGRSLHLPRQTSKTKAYTVTHPPCLIVWGKCSTLYKNLATSTETAVSG